MASVLLFPFSRSHGIVRTFATAMAATDVDDHVNEAWRSNATALFNQLAGAVSNASIDSELYRLLDAATFVAARKREAGRNASNTRNERKARRPQVARPIQLELFDRSPPNGPVFIGEMVELGR